MISSTTQSQPCGTHQLPDAGRNPSITNHQASAGSRSVSVESNTTGTVKHHTNSGSGTGSYVRTAVTFVASTALALLNNVSTTVGQNISAFNGTTAFPIYNGTTTAGQNISAFNGTTAFPIYNGTTTAGQNVSAFNGTTAFPIYNGTTAAPTPTKCEPGDPFQQGILLGVAATVVFVGFVTFVAIAFGGKNHMKGALPETDQESSGGATGPQAARSDEALAAQPEKSMV